MRRGRNVTGKRNGETGVLVYRHPNPEMRSFLVREEIFAHRVEHFINPLSKDSEEALGHLGSVGGWIVKEIMEIPGVMEIRIKPKEILMKKEQQAFWEDIEDRVIRILDTALRRKRIRLVMTVLVLALYALAGFFPALSFSAQNGGGTPRFDDYPLPKSVSLCGESLPIEDPYVREMLDREFTIAVWDVPQVFMWLKRAGRFFPHIEESLAREGMPEDLKYLAVAESSLLDSIRSNRGALGTWQFMADTGSRHGLRKDRGMDERKDFEESTDAALMYLRKLKDEFGSWTLALAAYNCGEARIREEIKVQKVNDYYRLNLPSETERFIFRIAAIKIIMENPRRYGYHLDQESIYRPVQCDRVQIKVRVPLHITDVARALGTDFKTIKEFNPQILGYYLPTGQYRVKLPTGLGSKIKPVLEELTRSAPPPSAKRASESYYVVQPGDTLNRIANRTGVSVATIKRLNGIQGSVIMVGQKIRLHP